MRLLNRKTLEMEWFVGEQRPSYVILSHRWQGAETSYREFLNHRQDDPAVMSDGMKKVLRFCQTLKDTDPEWVWVDTCCIDKTSSAELQEAINSMYKWYEDADWCCVYMDDVSRGHDDAPTTDSAAKGDEQWAPSFKQSRWFTRGWTLQELLAPKEQYFYDRDWQMLASRRQLTKFLRQRTGIRVACFGSKEEIQKTIVAERMSWMSERITTRVEDVAYCMLGIFDVNMTMLYGLEGEGDKAFIRLQREIINNIEDESLFAWTIPENADSRLLAYSGCIAPSPRCFAQTAEWHLEKTSKIIREPYRLTNRGLEIEICYQKKQNWIFDTLRLVLNCTVGYSDALVVLDLHKPSDSNVWKRVKLQELKNEPYDSHYNPPSESGKSWPACASSQSLGLIKVNRTKIPRATSTKTPQFPQAGN